VFVRPSVRLQYVCLSVCPVSFLTLIERAVHAQLLIVTHQARSSIRRGQRTFRPHNIRRTTYISEEITLVNLGPRDCSAVTVANSATISYSGGLNQSSLYTNEIPNYIQNCYDQHFQLHIFSCTTSYMLAVSLVYKNFTFYRWSLSTVLAWN